MRRAGMLLSLGLLGAAPGPELTLAMGHSGDVLHIDGSADGRWALSGGEDGQVLLWDVEAGRPLRSLPVPGRVVALSLSADGRWAAAAGFGAGLSVWSAETGALSRVIELPSEVIGLGLSGDGARLWAATTERLRLWDGAGGLLGEVLLERTEFVIRAEFIEAGLVVAGNTRLGLYSAADLAPIWSQELPLAASGLSAAGGGRVAVALRDGEVRILDAASGETLDSVRYPMPGFFERLRARFNPVVADSLWGAGPSALAISPDGRFLAVGGSPGAVMRVELDTGRVERWESGPTRELVVNDWGEVWARDAFGETCRYTPDDPPVCLPKDAPGAPPALALAGRAALTSRDDGALLWSEGARPRALAGLASAPVAAFFETGGRSLLVAYGDGAVWRWQALGAEEVVAPRGPDRLLQAAISADGQTLALRSGVCEVRELDLVTLAQQELGCVRNLADWAPRGGALGAASGATAWDLDVNGARYPRGQPDAALLEQVYSHAANRAWLSPDRARALLYRADGVFVADLASGARRPLADIGAFYPPEDAVWSWDGARVLLRSQGGEAGLWSAETGQRIAKIDLPSSLVHASFSRDGQALALVSRDGFVRLFSGRGADERARLARMRDGAWAVADAEGHFDTSNGDSIPGLYWVDGRQIVLPEQVAPLFYAPGLLAGRLGSPDRAPPVVAPELFDPNIGPDFGAPAPARRVGLGDLAPHPKLELRDADPATGEFTLRVRDGGGGIGPLLVLINGSELFPLPEPSEEDGWLVFRVQGSEAPTWRELGANTVSAIAYNADATLSSPPLVHELAAQAAAPAPVALHAVVVGTADYTGEALDLRYAADDAARVARALELASAGAVAEGTMRPGRIRLLATAPGAEPPTRAKVLAALDGLREAAPQDVIFVYFAGHGVTRGAGEGAEYYYLSAESSRLDELEDEARRAAVTVSGSEIRAALNRSPATQRVLVLDTCGAGSMLSGLGGSRGGGDPRAMEQLRDRSGTFVLAGSPADAVSYESKALGQGLLTYALLSALKGPGLVDEVSVDVQRTLSYARDQVPRLAAGMGNVQRPLLLQPPSGNFTLGRLDAAARAAIPLPTPRPVVARSAFVSEDPPWSDAEGLGREVDALLQSSADGPDAGWAFVDAERFSGAWQLRGRYRVEGDTLSVEFVWIDPSGKAGAPARLSGAPAELARAIAASAPVR